MHRFNLPINLDRQALEDFCLSRGIRKLSLFGSALRDDFRPGESDFDVLAEFKPGALKGIGLDFFSYGDELEKILGGKVDFCSKLNRYIKPLVEKESVPIYEQV
jgi:predicted nucleotidyltransferase